jgi:hypothetical protein
VVVFVDDAIIRIVRRRCAVGGIELCLAERRGIRIDGREYMLA